MSRYGIDYYGAPNGCPEEMYPWDVDYEGDLHDSFEEFKCAAYYDVLNIPVSWFFHSEDEGGEFELVLAMPRKGGRTWSLRLAPGFDRDEVEDWLEDWTKEFAAAHFGWTKPLTAPTE